MYIGMHIPAQEPAMTRLATRNICTMTELREPQKVFDRANGEPVAILKNSQLVGYLVPAEAMPDHSYRAATLEEVMESLARTRERVKPVLDYLRDK
jgi:antitoxin StbD